MKGLKARLPRRSSLTVIVACCGIAAFGSAVAFGSGHKSKTPVGKGDGVIGHITWNKASLKSAEKGIASITNHPSPYVVTQKLNKKPAKGGLIVFLDCGDPECEEFLPGLENAAKVFGWTVKSIPAGLTPTTVEAAVQSAIADQPQAIFDPGYPPFEFQQSASTLEADHISVVGDAINTALAAPVTGELADNADVTETGADMADAIYELGGNQVRAVFADAQAIPLSLTMEKGFAARLSQLCPACTTTETQIPVQDIGQPAMVAQEVSTVQGHPGTTWLAGFAGSFLIGAPAGLSGAGLHINTLSQSGGTINLHYIKAHQQTADLTVDYHQVGWIAMDMFARLATGQKIPASEEGKYAPRELFTRRNVPTVGNNGWYASPHFAQHYEKLWGFKK
jgi:ribose transport system substrate-binding protein